METDSNDPDFRVVIAETPDVLIVLFWGNVTAEEVPQLEDTLTKINGKPQRIVIFNFRDVPDFAAAAHPFLVEIQRDLRSQQRVFGLCGLRPEVRTTLTGAGIVREGEIFNNVPVAWKRLKKS